MVRDTVRSGLLGSERTLSGCVDKLYGTACMALDLASKRLAEQLDVVL